MDSSVLIKIRCTQKNLNFIRKPPLAAGDKNATKIEWVFCDIWKGYTKTALFSCKKTGGKVIPVIVENDICVVPPEVLKRRGKFYVSVRGDKDGITLTSSTLEYEIGPSLAVGEITPSDTTPDIYNQLVTLINKKADNIMFNTEDSTIQLSASGVLIGDKIKVNTNGGEGAGTNVFDGGVITPSVPDSPTEDDDFTPPDKENVIDYIVNNNIPFYSGVIGKESSEVEYQLLDVSTANYTDQGFYTITDNNGKTTSAGYQMTFEENTENIAQVFSVCSAVKIVAAYQYYPALNQWLDMGFDGIYWVENGTDTKVINGKAIIFTTYSYNTELMGDAITSPEYWRFEVEVL